MTSHGPITWHWLLILPTLGAMVYVQRFWFYETRRWWLALVSGRQSAASAVRWHRAAFLAFLAGLLLVSATHHYRVSAWDYWLTVAVAIYLVTSVLAALPLMLLRWSEKRAGQRQWHWWRAPEVTIPRDTAAQQPRPEGTARPAAGRRRFLQLASGALVAAPLAASAYGFAGERLDVQLDQVRLPLGPLAAGARGRTIAQISDIHISPYFSALDLRRVVDMVNELNADVVIITGDFVTFAGESQYDCVRELQRLRARTARLGCLGNHEVYTHTQDSITALCAERDIDVLRQRARPVRLGNATVNFTGIDFLFPGFENRVRRIAPLLAHDQANVLLSHNPNVFDHLTGMPVDACLSGHTHGGQIRLDLLGLDVTPALLMSPYVAGRFQRGRTTLYVNRGLGTIGVPIRLGAPPEITLYEVS